MAWSKEKQKQSQRKYRERNREKVKASHKKWRERNPEKMEACRRKWQERNREKQRQCVRKWQERNREKQKRYNRKWQEKNKETIKNHRKKLKMETFQKYSETIPFCACCGEKKIEFLCIDHIGGGGNKHRKQLRKESIDIYHWLKKHNYPKGFRVLCFNCNNALGFFGYCPHQKEGTSMLNPIELKPADMFSTSIKDTPQQELF